MLLPNVLLAGEALEDLSGSFHRRFFTACAMRPFSTHTMRRFGRPSESKGSEYRRVSSGSLQIVTRLSTNWSPMQLPPPGLQKNERHPAWYLPEKVPLVRFVAEKPR